MSLPAALIGAATGLSRLNAALTGVADGCRLAGQSLLAVDAVGQEFATAFDLAGPGSQNMIEAEIMRRLFARGGLVGVQNPTEAEIFRRLVTVTIKRV